MNLEKVETLDRAANGSAADLFDNADPVIRVNDLITYAKTLSAHEKGPASRADEGNAVDIIVL